LTLDRRHQVKAARSFCQQVVDRVGVEPPDLFRSAYDDGAPQQVRLLEDQLDGLFATWRVVFQIQLAVKVVAGV
jgi:hypothetical protein